METPIYQIQSVNLGDVGRDNIALINDIMRLLAQRVKKLPESIVVLNLIIGHYADRYHVPKETLHNILNGSIEVARQLFNPVSTPTIIRP